MSRKEMELQNITGFFLERYTWGTTEPFNTHRGNANRISEFIYLDQLFSFQLIKKIYKESAPKRYKNEKKGKKSFFPPRKQEKTGIFFQKKKVS